MGGGAGAGGGGGRHSGAAGGAALPRLPGHSPRAPAAPPSRQVRAGARATLRPLGALVSGGVARVVSRYHVRQQPGLMLHSRDGEHTDTSMIMHASAPSYQCRVLGRRRMLLCSRIFDGWSARVSHTSTHVALKGSALVVSLCASRLAAQGLYSTQRVVGAGGSGAAQCAAHRCHLPCHASWRRSRSALLCFPHLPSSLPFIWLLTNMIHAKR